MPIPVESTPIWEPTSVPPPSTGGSESVSSAPSTTFAGPPLNLSVPMIMQEERNWCWAACIEMIMAFHNTAITQCSVAQLLFTERNCCANQDSCDEGCEAPDVKNVLRKDPIKVECRRYSRSLSFRTIEREIGNQRPVAAGVLWFSHDGQPRGGHLILIKGCHTENNKPFVKVNDPWYGPIDVPFTKLKSYYGPDDDDQDGVWEHTWIKIRK